MRTRASRKPERILVVDDEIDTLELLHTLLESEGYQVDTAFDGADALDAVAAEPPDLILLDIMMPGMDGYEVCKALADRPETVGIPVLFLSAKREHFDRVYATIVGGCGYMTKPFQPELLVQKVEELLAWDRRRARKASA